MGCTSTAGEGIPSTYNSEVGKYCYLLRVTPLESGEYTIVSHTDFDTYVTLYEVRNGVYYEVASNDDGGLNTNFLLTYYLEAGVEYAFAIGKIGYDGCYDVIDYVLSSTNETSCDHQTKEFLTSKLDDHIASDTVTVVNMDLCTECGAALTMQLVTSGNGEEIELPVIPAE